MANNRRYAILASTHKESIDYSQILQTGHNDVSLSDDTNQFFIKWVCGSTPSFLDIVGGTYTPVTVDGRTIHNQPQLVNIIRTSPWKAE